MRRIALILLVVLLPLQSIWAAASNACPYGRASAGKHAADQAHAQAHEHAGTAAIADDGSASADGHSGNATGSTCHSQSNAAVLAQGLLTAALSAAGFVPSPYARFVAERFLESPLRPPVLQLA